MDGNCQKEIKNSLYDFKKTVSDQIIYSHYTTGRDFLKEYGIDLVAEAGGPGPPIWNSCPVDALKALGKCVCPTWRILGSNEASYLCSERSCLCFSYLWIRRIVDAEVIHYLEKMEGLTACA